MPKRSGDTLTGGSKDVNPQYMTSPLLAQTAADVTFQAKMPLPIPRLPTREGKNLVIELLGAEFFIPGAGLQAGNNAFYTNVTTNPNVPPNSTAGYLQAIQDPRTLADSFKFVFLFTNVGMTEFPAETQVDLTDAAGHGVLVATDNLYFNLITQNTGSLNQAVVRLEYRWKEVSLVEYIGIVQSQQ